MHRISLLIAPASLQRGNAYSDELLRMLFQSQHVIMGVEWVEDCALQEHIICFLSGLREVRAFLLSQKKGGARRVVRSIWDTLSTCSSWSRPRASYGWNVEMSVHTGREYRRGCETILSTMLYVLLVGSI